MTQLRKFYYFTSSFLIIGLSWVGWNLFCFQQAKSGLQICVFKYAVGVACPSCGTTRSILHVLHGDIANAILYAVDSPPHVNVNEILIRPTTQEK